MKPTANINPLKAYINSKLDVILFSPLSFVLLLIALFLLLIYNLFTFSNKLATIISITNYECIT